MPQKNNPEWSRDHPTPTPGVYRRLQRYRLVYRTGDSDRRLVRTFATYEEARDFKLSLPSRTRESQAARALEEEAQRLRERESARKLAMNTKPRQRQRLRAYLLSDPCAYCNERSTTIDHIEPTVKGGADEWSNMAGACRRCNSSKQDQPLLLFLLTLLTRPTHDPVWDFDLFQLLDKPYPVT